MFGFLNRLFSKQKSEAPARPPPPVTPVQWHAEQEWRGFKLKAFFMPDTSEIKDLSLLQRNVPFFKNAKPKVLSVEGDKVNYAVGELIGQPDAVLEHGAGLISIEFKSNTRKRKTNQSDFSSFISETHLLQCLAMAMVVAANTGKPTAPVLLYKTAVFLLEPNPKIIQYMIASFTPARQYFATKVETKEGGFRNNVSQYISASMLAKYCVARLEFDYPDNSIRNQKSSEQGKIDHADQFRDDSA